MENKVEKIKDIRCPICGQASRFFCHKGPFDLYRCGNCFLIFLWPVPDASGIYGTDYFSGATLGYGYADYDNDKKAMAGSFARYLAEIEKFAKGKSMLDIGAATGFFMGEARTKGWAVSGVEISEHASSAGRIRGFDIKTGILENADFCNSSFNVITMWDVLEHIPDPSRTIAKIYALLAVGGILAINTPDNLSTCARMMGCRWHLIVPPEHIFLFNRKALELLLKQNGFEILAIKKIGKSFSLPYLLHIAGNWLKIPTLGKIGDFFEKGLLRKIAIPLNLRDNIFVIARKK
jgi:spore maturation protein CgeB